jgi:hypothetical protein
VKIVAAVGELESEYAGRIDFVLIPADETAKRFDEIEAFGFKELKHGLVGFSSDRDPLVKIPGHNFGKPEIVAAIETLLDQDP